MQVVPMHLKHIEGVVAVEKQCFPTPWSKYAFMSELVDNDFAHYLVAVKDNQVIGYCGVWIIFNEAHITNIAVHPEFQGYGLGKRLLRSLIDLVMSMGADKMTLEVRKSNLIAQTLYEDMGFKTYGLRKGYYSDTKEDAIIMWKEDLVQERGEQGANT